MPANTASAQPQTRPPPFGGDHTTGDTVNKKQRPKRATPQRTKPHRNSAGFFRKATNDEAPPKAQHPPPSSRYGAVDEGVAAAYRVNAEYMRRGQQSAQQYNPHPTAPNGYGYAGRSMAQSMEGWSNRALQGYWQWANMWLNMMPPMMASPWRMAEYFARFAGANMQNTGMPGMAPAPVAQAHNPWSGYAPAAPVDNGPRSAATTAGATTADGGATNPGALTMNIIVEASQPVRASIELSSESDGVLVVRPLHCAQAQAQLGQATIEFHDSGATVHIRVPNEQPAGHYVGSVHNTTDGAQVGAISVQLMTPSKAPSGGNSSPTSRRRAATTTPDGGDVIASGRTAQRRAPSKKTPPRKKRSKKKATAKASTRNNGG